MTIKQMLTVSDLTDIPLDILSKVMKEGKLDDFSLDDYLKWEDRFNYSITVQPNGDLELLSYHRMTSDSIYIITPQGVVLED